MSHDHDSHGHHAEHKPSNNSGKNHWEQELEKPSLKEAPFIAKKDWLRPLSSFLNFEFKGKQQQYNN